MVPTATYHQLSPSGHCPHDEAPALFALSLSSWAAEVTADAPPLLRLGESISEDGVTLRCVDDSPSSASEYVVWVVYTLTSAVQRALRQLMGSRQQSRVAG